MLRKIAVLALAGLMMTSCQSRAQENPMPQPTPQGTLVRADVQWPKDKLTLMEDGTPQLKVYVTADEQLRTMELEKYVEGVLAGEMKNSWPMEALKAQAILARTFVLKFVEEKESRYEGAQISTDIEEAQAYSASDINDRIRQAVSETRGMVLSSSGLLPYAWFHAHSGGLTDAAQVGLGWNKDEPLYTQSVKSEEPETVDDPADNQVLKDAQRWSAVFPYEEFESACASLGVETVLEEDSDLTISKRGKSGRADLIDVNGHPLKAAELRIALGSTKMRSTLLTSLIAKEGNVHMAGRGYGHGVGMSQWGAYGLAEQGKTAEEIVKHYFRGVTVEKIW